MGQQQLLLLVLGIVIVGLAVVVGIQAFGENQKKANSDALVNDGVRIASDAQAWTLKPLAFSGGNGVPTNVTLAALGYTVASGTYTNLNGAFTLAATATSIIISGSSTANSNFVSVAVYGPTSQCIATAIGSTAPTAPSKPSGCTAAMDW
jgi:hypothetical protein